MRLETEIDADALRDFVEEIRGSRRFCAVLWGFVLAFAAAATTFSDPMGLTLSFVGALITTLLTLGMGKPTINERLHRPVLYRFVSGSFLAVALFGVVLAALPSANDSTKILGVYFGLVALLAYRAVVSRGPRAALAAVTVAMVSMLPFAFLTLATCSCRRGAPPWTETAAQYTLEILLMSLPVLAIVALVAFRPRHDFVPDARLLRKRRAE